MVKLRSTRSHRYNTRALRAGDDFEASSRDARILKALRRAEDVPLEDEDAPVVAEPPRRRGRPPKAAAPEPVSMPAPEPLEEKTVDDLRSMAEERGVDLPGGYVKKDELIERLEDAQDDDGSDTKAED